MAGHPPFYIVLLIYNVSDAGIFGWNLRKEGIEAASAA